jgi:integrase/recombinase XerD
MIRKSKGLARHIDTSSFGAFVDLAIHQVTQKPNTVAAYWQDVRVWLAFCETRGIDPKTPRRQEVRAWIEDMKAGGARSRTRARRVSALCSVYRELRRELTDKDGKEVAPVVMVANPFSVDDGPKREKAVTRTPTPVAKPAVVKAILATCDDSPLGVRDRALIRVMWGTGLRRSSVVEMTLERLIEAEGGYETLVEGKGDKLHRVLIRGSAAHALDKWLAIVRAGGFTTGPLWRTRRSSALGGLGIWQMMRRRAELAGVKLSPHMLRVAFLTFNKASLDEKQDAAGHADPATTRLYDRTEWKGRAAFEQMPEVEDV